MPSCVLGSERVWFPDLAWLYPVSSAVSVKATRFGPGQSGSGCVKNPLLIPGF